jgi:hypothetical protein
MSQLLDSCLDAERLAECQRNDLAMRTMTHAHLMETTRRYPRTVAEAFKGPEYSDPIERPEPTLLQRAWAAIKEWRL